MSPDFSLILLENIEKENPKVLLSEQDLHILNEGFGDFFNSIKNLSIDKLKRMIDIKYERIEDVRKKHEKVLKEHKIDTERINSIVNNVVIRYKSKIEDIGKRKDGKSLNRTVSEMGVKVKEELKKKEGTWFNLKYWDPETLLLPLAITILLITVKAVLLVLLIWFSPFAGGPLFATIFHFIFMFVVMPMLEESARMFSIKMDAGGTFSIMYNAADTALMFVAYVAAPAKIFTAICVRLFSVAIHGANHYIQKMGHLSDESEVSFRIAWCLNSIRNFIEIMLMFIPSLTNVAGATV